MSLLNVDKVDPSTGTALEIGSSGDTVSVPSGATFDISASTLTPPATMPASSGINFTALNATNLGSGTVPTARLGTGSASSSVFLAGDSTWIAAGGGKVLQVVNATYSTQTDSTSMSYADTGLTATITPSATSSKVLVHAMHQGWQALGVSSGGGANLLRDTTEILVFDDGYGYNNTSTRTRGGTIGFTYLDSPSSTSAVVYKTQFRNKIAASDAICLQVNDVASTITLMEIGE
jgi:hypothetical protein